MTSRERLQPMLISFNFSKQKIKKLSTLFSLSNLLNKHPKRICKSLNYESTGHSDNSISPTVLVLGT